MLRGALRRVQGCPAADAGLFPVVYLRASSSASGIKNALTGEQKKRHEARHGLLPGAHAPGSGSGAPPPEVSVAELSAWEGRIGGTAASAVPDFIEAWSRKRFWQVGAAGGAATATATALLGVHDPLVLWMGVPLGLYFALGLRDMNQNRHTVLRNFPVLGNIRYVLETIRPEIRQYFVEGAERAKASFRPMRAVRSLTCPPADVPVSTAAAPSDHSRGSLSPLESLASRRHGLVRPPAADTEAAPFTRLERNIVYQRAKGAPDTLPFGTRQNVYAPGYEWILHSTLAPCRVPEEASRVLIGGDECAPQHRYSSSLFNVSGMSYGALSDNAVLALNTAARMGAFSHNTGEGGISRFHLAPGGDIVWNIGTGYFGCRDPKTGAFSPARFRENASSPAVKMIEIKLGQGAKPAHGGILPGSKVSAAIAEARGVAPGEDCLSPLRHSAFDGAHGLLAFVARLRELSGGKPVGFKLCVGDPVEVMAIVQAMVDTQIVPDFITVDGGEGGTGAAPLEFSTSVGTPLLEGLSLVHRSLVGAGLRPRTRIICSGKVTDGFGLVRNLALGADVCNAARAMMFALGCIQALKCNSNKCPTGVATQDPELMAGLVPEDKALRVYRYHHATVHAALELVGAMGLSDPADVRAHHIMRRVSAREAVSYSSLFPEVEAGALLEGTAPAELQAHWDTALARAGRPRGAQALSVGVGVGVGAKREATL